MDRMLMGDGERLQIGLGIGLRYVLRILKAHYGDSFKFQIDSRVGEGTTIQLLLPADPPEMESEWVLKKQKSLPSPLKSDA